MKSFLLSLFVLPLLSANAQDSLDQLMNELDTVPDTKVSATFKAYKLINAHTIETVKKGTLDFRITHRFGNTGANSGGGGHTLGGFDEANDIRLSFDYGITDKISVGIARNKRWENIDGTFKWRFLEQTKKAVPVSICLFTNAAFTPMEESQIYIGVDSLFTHSFAHRFAYTSQLIIARKFNSKLSLELIGNYTHRNFIKESYNSEQVKDKNGVPAVGIAGRIKLNKRISLVFDYFYPISAYRSDLNLTQHPLAIGIEIETGGHVFHLNFTNATGILESDYIPNTTDDWLDGGFKFGFNISRVFTIIKPKM